MSLMPGSSGRGMVDRAMWAHARLAVVLGHGTLVKETAPLQATGADVPTLAELVAVRRRKEPRGIPAVQGLGAAAAVGAAAFALAAAAPAAFGILGFSGMELILFRNRGMLKTFESIKPRFIPLTHV